jgi:hypothetical protein
MIGNTQLKHIFSYHFASSSSDGLSEISVSGFFSFSSTWVSPVSVAPYSFSFSAFSAYMSAFESLFIVDILLDKSV